MGKTPAPGHIIEDFMDGATHIVICDDCIHAEETMGILEEVGQFAYEVLAGTEGK